MTDPCLCSAQALRAGYRDGSLTPLAVVQAHLARVAAMQPRINAFVHVDAEGALAAARASGERWRSGQPLGPLDGVPVTLKDNLHAAGMPTTWGSRLFANLRPAADESPVARLRAGGAVLLGKTNLPEFAMQGFTDSPLHGPARNPWDTRLTPGGSSGGAAAGLAAGCGTLALGTDGGGSIRRPAAHNGLLGYKPSRGAVPRSGDLPGLFLDFEQVGGFARDADDLIDLAGVLAPGLDLAQARARPEGLRILYIARLGAHPVDPRILAQIDQAAQQLAALGHAVQVSPPFLAAERATPLWSRLSGAGLAWLAARLPELEGFGGQAFDEQALGPTLREVLQQGRAMSAAELFDLLREREQVTQALEDLFTRHDIILTPATAALPWPVPHTHPTHIDGQPVGPRGHALYTPMVNAAGLPGVAVPCGMIDHLPNGLQLIGPRGADARVLALARAYLQAHPWTPRWPGPA